MSFFWSLAFVGVIIISFIVSVIRAYCPNECSNHGICGDYDKCYCNRGIDGQYAWTGADCSLRMCPKYVIMIWLPFHWNCVMFSAPFVNFVSYHVSPRAKAWIGPAAGANDIHPVAECSNMGSCDRYSGLCSCFDGFEGFACDRMECPNMCSYHGVSILYICLSYCVVFGGGLLTPPMKYVLCCYSLLSIYGFESRGIYRCAILRDNWQS
jgi:hypothetical protein